MSLSAQTPTLLIRSTFVDTFSETKTVTAPDGTPLVLDSSKMDPSQFGHRRGFVLENVEIGLKGKLEQGWYYAAKAELVPREKDGNRSSDYLKDAYFGWHKLGFLDLSVGRMKVPFSQANLKPTESMALIYAPTLDVLTQKRQIGLKAIFSDPEDIGRLSLGVFNSSSVATEQIRDFDQLLSVARLDLRADRALRHWLSLPENLEWNLGVNVAYVYKNFDPPTQHRWLGLDTRLAWWQLVLEAEGVLKDFYPGTPLSDGSQRSERGWGWHVDLTVQVLPNQWDVTARFEDVDGDSLVRGFSSTFSIDELSRQRHRWITVGVVGHVTSQVKLSLNYIHRVELEGYSFSNDVILGLFQLAL